MKCKNDALGTAQSKQDHKGFKFYMMTSKRSKRNKTIFLPSSCNLRIYEEKV